MKSIFSQDGELSRFINNYESRDEQTEMADFILDCLSEAQSGLIEAGTGTGKTLAYLVPSILYGLKNDKKVYVSTETKALQKQLLDKDLPLVEKLFKEHYGDDFTYALCLGSANYPCRRKIDGAIAHGKVDKKNINRVMFLRDAIDDGEIITRFDINISGHLWKDVCREADACSPNRCPSASKCSFQKARKEWQKADILIMNHYLFFSNVATEKTYLPQGDIVIFDEAHSVESIASHQLGFKISYDDLVDLMGRFYRPRKKNTLLSNIINADLRERAIKNVKEITIRSSEFFEKCRDLLENKNQLRLTAMTGFGKELIELLKNFILLLADIEEDFEDEYLKMEFDVSRGRLFLFTENIKSFVYHSYDNYVYWLEQQTDAVAGNVFCLGQPIEVSEILNREVNNHYDSCLYVSATLSINEDFTFTANRLGLQNYEAVMLKSSFNYKTSMVAYIGRWISDPSQPAFLEQAATASAEIIKLLDGSCLMLFTSYKMLREIKEILEDEIDNPIYSQEDYAPGEAFDLYRRDDNAVLMGTHSYWQGIDLPGDLVKGVIMMKLPFGVPDTPPMEAKIESLKKRGLNPFMAMQVPETVIKFKQGIGRLIRSKKDKGIIAILDSRVYTKPYGNLFTGSIPECERAYGISELKGLYSKLLEE